jgi:putative phosphoribosyl transferase
MTPLFKDRAEAGQILARSLKSIVPDSGALVLALPRGGVPVGFEIARSLACDLDVFLVRKLGVPGQEELAMGAIASGGVTVLNDPLIRRLGIPPAIIDRAIARERQEIERREQTYREGNPPLAIENRRIILVDDGVATGASMLAAMRAYRIEGAEILIVAVPVASREACEEFNQTADAVMCAETPEPFCAVGVWYRIFRRPLTPRFEIC